MTEPSAHFPSLVLSPLILGSDDTVSEVLSCIFSFCTYRELVSFSFCSRLLRSLSNSETLWKPLALSRWSELALATSVDSDPPPAWKSCFGRKFSEGSTTLADFMNDPELGRCDWYSCPNGHLFVIGECRRPMRRAKCATCGARIGGARHKMFQGNQHLGAVNPSRRSKRRNRRRRRNRRNRQSQPQIPLPSSDHSDNHLDASTDVRDLETLLLGSVSSSNSHVDVMTEAEERRAMMSKQRRGRRRKRNRNQQRKDQQDEPNEEGREIAKGSTITGLGDDVGGMMGGMFGEEEEDSESEGEGEQQQEEIGGIGDDVGEMMVGMFDNGDDEDDSESSEIE